MPVKKLESVGYSIESNLIQDDYDGHSGGHTHKVTIRLGDKSMECEYTSGSAHRTHPRTGKPPKFAMQGLTIHDKEQNLLTRPNDPDLADVLYSLLSDASVGRDAMSFGEFCDEYGYDEDSRKAFSIFTACLEQYASLKRLGVDLEVLDTILEDY